MKEIRCIWHSYKYFPYERMLGVRELATLCAGDMMSENDHVIIANAPCRREDLSRLTYFKVVESKGLRLIPDQTKLEASAATNGSTWRPENNPIPDLRRQCTRYSAHGLHEYRGKFNPQVVRSIGNMLGLKKGAWLLDPFCGSGTTVLEAAHIGWNCLGVDVNPLSVAIANAKIGAFNSDAAELERASALLVSRLHDLPNVGTDWAGHLPNSTYLEQWFPLPVLMQLSQVVQAINVERAQELRMIFRIVLSDILRNVSLQDPGDLRIRRRKNPSHNYPAIELFIETLRSKVAAIVRARRFIDPHKGTCQRALMGDCRMAGLMVRDRAVKHGQAFDAAITSPPYATALPYMDTQRLSLALLGLIEPRELRSREKQQIGNREITDARRRTLEAHIVNNNSRLPRDVHSFCLNLLKLADHPKHGFRRRNVPALVYQYLSDMADMFVSVHSAVKAGGRYALLVGRNSTTLRGQEVEINTPRLLASIAEARRWSIEEILTFDTYQRFDMHRSNSITAEELVVLRRS